MKPSRTLALCLFLSACQGAQGGAPEAPHQEESDMERAWNDAARRYVVLVLALGEHDADFVDAYYGPEELRDEVKARKLDLPTIRSDAKALGDSLAALPSAPDWAAARRTYLQGQLRSLVTRTEQLAGTRLPFDEESRLIYDAVSPSFDDAHFAAIVQKLETALPGTGRLVERYDAFRKDFEIPKDKLDAVFKTAIRACRDRTLEHVVLPAGETFTLEYVTDKPWSGYNWYKGDFKSVIQVNTDLPISIDRAIDLACHEGYPGHHVYNVLLEQKLVKEHGFVEFTVYPLFSGQSLIAEGSANYGVDLTFPGETRAGWEREHLFPLAGLDPAKAELYYQVQDLTHELSYAGNLAAKRYLDGERTAEQTVTWLEDFALMTHDRAAQRVRFMDKYRAYVINYNLGQDLVKAYVERHAQGDASARFPVFFDLLSAPRLPSDLTR